MPWCLGLSPKGNVCIHHPNLLLHKGEKLCRSPWSRHIHARQTGPEPYHPPWPPLRKGERLCLARSGSFQEGTVAEARVTTTPAPPFTRGGKVHYAVPIVRNKNTRFAIKSPIQSIPTFHHPSLALPRTSHRHLVRQTSQPD